jgi:alpha-1,6-mannosyltransferase
MLYAAHSGGVRRYIDAKHDWLTRHTRAHHSVVAPRGRRGPCEPYQHQLPAWPLPLSGGFRFPVRMQPWLALLERLAPDLIEAGDPYRLGWAALEAGQRLGIPTTGFYHSDLPSLLAARFGRFTGRLAERYVADFYARFDLVLAPSRVMQRKLQSLGVARVRVQALGVDAEGFHPRRRSGALRRRLRLAAATHLLVFAGRNAREKHLDRLCQAMSLLGSRYHLLLVGPDMVQPSLPNVSVWARYADARELAVLLASCDALVHAGDAETFGLIVLEAMACGIPVVGVDAGAIPELVTAATGTLARSSRPAHLAEATSALFERDVREMGRTARRNIEAQWTWDHSFRSLLHSYQTLLHGRAALVQEDLLGAAG